MAAPTFVKVHGDDVETSGNLVAANIGVATAGNVVLVQWVTDTISGTEITDSIVSTVNLEKLDGTDGDLTRVVDRAPIGSPAAGSQTIWLGRVISTLSTASSTTITITNNQGEAAFLRWYEFTNVNTGTTLADVIENGTAGATSSGAGTGTGISDVSVQTLGPDRLALNVVGVNDDNAVDAFTGMSGGTWAEATAEFASQTSTDACLQVQSAAMASAGTIDGGSYTMAASDGWGVVGFALIGTTPSYTPRHGFVHFNDPGIL